MTAASQSARHTPALAEESGYQRIRVMQLCGLDYGVYMHLLPVIQCCENSGFEVISCGPPGTFCQKIVDLGYRYIQVPFTRNLDIANHYRCLKMLKDILKSESIDILHTHTLIGGLIGRIAADQAGVPISVYTAHGFRFFPEQNPIARRIYVELERLGSRYTDYIFTQNREDRDSAIRYGLATDDKVSAIGNGVDIERFDRNNIASRKLNALRAELSIPANATVVTTISRPTKEKGATDFIKMANAVTRQRPDIYFIAVWPPIINERHSVYEKLLRQPATGNLRILGLRDDVAEILALTDIFVLASKFEGLSRSLLESMVSGAAPVVSDVRGNREIVQHGVTGLLSPPSNVDAFVGHLIELIDHTEYRARLAHNARMVATDKYDEKFMLREQVRVISNMAIEHFGDRATKTLYEV